MRPSPLVLVFAATLAGGCAGFGVYATPDPSAKLNDATYLYTHYERHLIAERLIWEAMDIFRERADLQGLGHADRTYAELLESPTLVKWEHAYRKLGFRDKSVTLENRLEKSKEYYRKAITNYELAEPKLMDAGQYDGLTNLYFNMAASYYRLGEQQKTCETYQKTSHAAAENLRRNPNAKPNSGRYSSIQEAIEAAKRYAGCA